MIYSRNVKNFNIIEYKPYNREKRVLSAES